MANCVSLYKVTNSYATPDQKTERINKLLAQEIVPMFGVPEAFAIRSRYEPIIMSVCKLL